MSFWKNKNVLLTGADGFVGSHLAEKLIDLGVKLTIVVRATSNHGTSAYNFKNLPNNYVKKCKKIILGCTELPIALFAYKSFKKAKDSKLFIDPNLLLAQVCMRKYKNN